MFRTTTQTFTAICPARALSLSLSRFCVPTHTRSMAAAHDKRTDGWASPGHFQRYAHRYAAKIRAEIQKGESREWTVPSKEEPRSGNDTPAPLTRLSTNTKDEEARPVPPRGSAIQQKNDQAGVNRDPIYRHSYNEPCDGRAFPAALANVYRDQV